MIDITELQKFAAEHCLGFSYRTERSPDGYTIFTFKHVLQVYNPVGSSIEIQANISY